MQQQNEAPPAPPTASRVLRDLAEKIEDLEKSPERISVMAGSPYNYMVRVYMTAGNEYEAVHLNY